MIWINFYESMMRNFDLYFEAAQRRFFESNVSNEKFVKIFNYLFIKNDYHNNINFLYRKINL